MDGATSKASFTATSGLPGYQEKKHQSWRGVGLIPECQKVGISNYSVLTEPYDRKANLGIAGDFFYINHPDRVLVDGIWRSEFGIHFDASVPGSSGCIVLRNKPEWNRFRKFMDDYNSQGFSSISLVVEYNASSPSISSAGVETSGAGTSFFTVDSPTPGSTLTSGTAVTFAGTATPQVSTVIVIIGSTTTFKVGEAKPIGGTWNFTQTLFSRGASRPLIFRALDNARNFLQDVNFLVTVI